VSRGGFLCTDEGILTKKKKTHSSSIALLFLIKLLDNLKKGTILFGLFIERTFKLLHLAWHVFFISGRCKIDQNYE
jgi:hypothetical protein